MLFAELPEALKEQVRCLLEAGDFLAAKALYDRAQPQERSGMEVAH